MDIILSQDCDTLIRDIQNWLDYHEIGYGYRTFWDLDQSMYNLPLDINNSIVVCDLGVFKDFLVVESQWPKKISDLCKFLDAGNKIWLIGEDQTQWLVKAKSMKFMRQVDQSIRPHSMLLLLEAEPSDRCYIHDFENIQYKTLPLALATRQQPRVKSSGMVKTNCKNSYLLTMRRKRNRPHREVLWKELNRRPDLLQHGLVAVHMGEKSEIGEKWIGQRPHQHDNRDQHASMDLYLDCWIEIVPETFYKDFYFITEKISKPIMTRTPFLVATTAGYLTWLKNQGFRTFDTLIDETYDQHYHIQDRIRNMADVMEDIISNGAENFYRASQDILDHNFARLCELSGSFYWRTDQILWQALKDFTPNTCSKND